MKILLSLPVLLCFSLSQIAFAGHFVIFDENEDFLEAGTGVDQGVQTVEVDSSDFYWPKEGGISLKMDSNGRGERYQVTIAAWGDGLTIVENPGEDEYRYLTFAWKGECDNMAMDFPSNSTWGKARYYAGPVAPFGAPIEQVDAKVPEDWKVYTVDLWKDFGDLNITGWNFFVENGTGWFDFIILHSDPELPKEFRLAVSTAFRMATLWGMLKSL